VVAMQDLIARRGRARALRLGLITLAGTLATLVSPYGIAAWLVVWNALRHYAAQPIIADWQPLLAAIAHGWRTNPAETIFFICGALVTLAFAIAFIRAPRGGDLPLAVIAAMMSVAAFAAVRNMPLAMIACAAPLARHTALLMARRRDRKLAQRPADLSATPTDRSGANPWLAFSIAVVLALFGGLFSTQIAVGSDSPVGAVAFMRRHDLHGNILSNFAAGEYLIWHTAPGSRVFIDGRYDTVYPQNVIDQYLDFINGRPNAPQVLQAYPHDFVMIPGDSPAFALMRHAAQWKLIYRDPDWILFARAASAAAKMSGVPIRGTPARKNYFP
jgi:hypothetical protein